MRRRRSIVRRAWASRASTAAILRLAWRSSSGARIRRSTERSKKGAIGWSSGTIRSDLESSREGAKSHGALSLAGAGLPHPTRGERQLSRRGASELYKRHPEHAREASIGWASAEQRARAKKDDVHLRFGQRPPAPSARRARARSTAACIPDRSALPYRHQRDDSAVTRPATIAPSARTCTGQSSGNTPYTMQSGPLPRGCQSMRSRAVSVTSGRQGR
jgi:hypothetical protein